MAALNFPANPSNGDEFEGYVYDSTLGVWNRKPSTVAYTVSPNAPTNPNDGDVWFNEQDGSSYIYYVDTDSEQWIEIGGKVGATGAAGQNGADGADGRFTNSATKPTNPVDGDVWFNTNNGKIFVYYDDGNTAQWVESGNPTLGYNTLENLSDTNITSPTNGQALVYNTSTSKWIPGDVSVDVYDVTNSSTGYLSIPKGTDAQRPQNPVNGDLRFNTESGEPEWYSEAAGQWIKFRLSPSQDFEYLVIAGGGGGGGYYSGGGGGAGGYRSSVVGQLSGGLQPAEATLSFAGGDVFTVAVGAGGAGGVSATGNDGLKGSDSVLASITSIGGGAGPGGGRTLASSEKDGGSGGGASGNVSNNLGGLGTTGQGFSGGNASTPGADYGAAGGGGAGEAGQDGTFSSNGNGGAGIFSNITGTSIQRGGGGGAGAHTPLFGADGGAGGGGDGGKTANAVGSSGDINSGGGGGGGQYSNPGAAGGAGGSGIVIIRYPATFNLTIGGGLTSVTTVVGDKKVTQFTAGLDQVTVG